MTWCISLLTHYFFRTFLNSQQNQAKVPWFAIYSLPQHLHSLPHYQQPSSKRYICYNWWTYLDTSLAHIHRFNQGSLDVTCSVSFNKFITTCIHKYRTIESSFTALNVLYALLIHPSLQTPPNPGNHFSFYYVHTFAFSRMSCSWNCSVCSLFK